MARPRMSDRIGKSGLRRPSPEALPALRARASIGRLPRKANRCRTEAGSVRPAPCAAAHAGTSRCSRQAVVAGRAARDGRWRGRRAPAPAGWTARSTRVRSRASRSRNAAGRASRSSRRGARPPRLRPSSYASPYCPLSASVLQSSRLRSSSENWASVSGPSSRSSTRPASSLNCSARALGPLEVRPVAQQRRLEALDQDVGAAEGVEVLLSVSSERGAHAVQPLDRGDEGQVALRDHDLLGRARDVGAKGV